MSRISRDQIEDVYGLSPGQHGMYFHSVLNPELAPYVQQGSWELTGSVDPRVLKDAWAHLVAEHPILRSVFREARKQPVQIVLRQQRLELEVHEPGDAAEACRRLAAAELERPFSLEDGPLFRVALVRRAAERWSMLWTFHHIIVDAWSGGLLLRQLCESYDALRNQRSPPRHAGPAFREYIAWIGRQSDEEALDYWRRRLEGFTAATPLPGAVLDAAPEPGRHRCDQRRLTPELTSRLRELALECRGTMAALLAAAWGILLARRAAEREVVFGLTVSGRPPELQGVESMVGPFINTVPLRVAVPGGSRIEEFVHGVQQDVTDAGQFSFVSGAEVQARSQLRSGPGLFRSVLNVAHAVDGGGVVAGALELRADREAAPPARTNYELLIDAVIEDRLLLLASYREGSFQEAAIPRLLEGLESLLEQMAAFRGQALRKIAALPAQEERRLLQEYAGSQSSWSLERPAISLFEERARENPDATAARFEGTAVSYGDLNAAAERVASWLRRREIGREHRVAMLGARGVGMLSTILGAFKAGAGYVPLDPAQPDARLRSIVERCRPAAVLADASAAARGAALAELAGAEAGCWDELPVAEEPARAVAPRAAGPRDMAYVFYTSGTTGAPKGAMLEQVGMLNHLLSKIELLGLDETSVVVQNASHCFDISVWQFLAPLLAGGRVLIVPDETALDPRRLWETIRREGATVLEVVPSLLEGLIGALEGGDSTEASTLRHLVCTGEALPVRSSLEWLRRRPGVPVVNAYGPTECSDDVAHALVSEPGATAQGQVAVGRPVPGDRLYVVDDELQPVPVGCVGEIAVGGVGVGRGYLDDPALTARQFAPDPYSDGARLYLSGDLGRWDEQGQLHFVGRRDNQVKIHGYRIELGEIEGALLLHPRLRRAAVVALPDSTGRQRLVAYTVSDAPIAARELRTLLSESLPAPMLPEAFVALDALPLTANGKLDRRRLPEPPDSEPPRSTPPRDAVEAVIARVWEEVLGTAPIGVSDDFFALGGHSLKTLQVRSRLEQHFGVEIPLRVVFGQPTVEEQAAAVAQLLQPGGSASSTIPRAPEAVRYPLSPAQRRLWFLHRLHPGDSFYSVSLSLPLAGRLDRPAFERALGRLLERHEILRTSFGEADGEPFQQVRTDFTPEVGFEDLSRCARPERERRLRRSLAAAAAAPFDLSEPPIRVRLLRLTRARALAAVVVHHIGSDGWSARLMSDELRLLYESERDGTASELIPLPIRYADYAVWLARQEGSGAWLEHERFWVDRLKAPLPELTLPTDAQPAATGRRPGTLARVVECEATDAKLLRELAQRRGASLFMLQTALAATFLARVCGQDEALLATPVAGRERPETEGLVGLFVNTLALRVDLSGDPGFEQVLDRVRARALEAYAHQAYPFDRLVQKLNPNRESDGFPLVRAMFVHADARGAPGSPRRAPPEGWAAHVQELARDAPWAGVDVMLGCVETEQGAVWGLMLRDDLFLPETADRLAQALRGLIADAAVHPRAPISELRLSEATRGRALEIQPLAASYPLSLNQSDMWFQCTRLQPGSGLNHSVAIRLDGPLQVAALREALRRVVARQAALRSVFPLAHGKPRLRILDPFVVDCPLSNLEVLPEQDRDAAVRRAVETLVAQAFEPDREPLFRARLLRISEARHCLIFAFHHLILDGFHWPQLLDELVSSYQACLDSQPPASEPQPGYRDFAVWQTRRFDAWELSRADSHWRRVLAPPLPAMPLPFDRPPSAERRFRTSQFAIRLEQRLVRQLKGLRRRQRTTVYRGIVAGFAAFLSRLTGEREALIAVPVSTRPSELSDVIGFFANTLPLRLDVRGRQPFSELLKEVSRQLRELTRNREFPLTEALRRLPLARDPGRPMLPVCVSQVRRLVREAGALHIEHGFPHIPTCPFDLWVMVAEEAEEIELCVLYAEELFEESSVRGLIDSFLGSLSELLESPEAPMSRTGVTGSSTRAAVVERWNSTRRPYPAQALHELFSARALAAPEATALSWQGERISYAELDRRGRRLATRLRCHGVGRDVLTAMVLDRGPWMIEAMLGVLAAGGAYAPLEAGLPSARLREFFASLRSPVVISQERFRAELRDVVPRETELICLDELTEPVQRSSPQSDAGAVEPDGLAYVNFTSGSTGRPKGVLVSHRAVVRLVSGADYLDLRPDDVVLQLSTYAWDAATFEIWGALLNGARLVLAPRDTGIDLGLLRRLVQDEQVSVMYLTSPLFNRVVDHSPETLAGLRALIVGGETASVSHFRRIAEALPELILINEYGPTENTAFSTWHRASTVPAECSSIPIGRPVSNSTAFVLDQELHPLPIGVAGELYLGGDGLARGYLADPGRTAESFVPNPFVPGERLYRSGDRARWSGGGELEFLGRVDSQLKVRGHRVEPGEVEFALERHPDIESAAVTVAGEGADAGLAAFVVVRRGAPPPAPTQLRRFLGERLPDYLIPGSYLVVDHLPLNAVGKLDRRALRLPSGRRDSGAVLVAPRDAVELAALQLWDEELGLTASGVLDDFFESGGHSLKAVSLLSRIERRFRVELPIHAFLREPTVAGLARLIRETVEGRQGGDASHHLVALESGQGGRPLYLAPPQGGTVFCYHLLARCLGGPRPVYGLRSPGLAEGEEALTSIDQMARLFGAEIRARQPVGPYALAGWSFGGAVAFELARQLEAAGEEVELLAILDTPVPPERAGERPDVSIGAVARAFLGGAAGSFDGLDEEAALRRFLEVGEELGVLLPGLSPGVVSRLVRVMQGNTIALADYRPCGRVAADLLLIRPVEGSFAPDPAGWRALTSGRLETVSVCGDHQGMVAAPAVFEVAESLRLWLGPERAAGESRRRARSAVESVG